MVLRENTLTITDSDLFGRDNCALLECTFEPEYQWYRVVVKDELDQEGVTIYLTPDRFRAFVHELRQLEMDHAIL